MTSESTSVGWDGMDDAAPDTSELAARLVDVVFEWRPVHAPRPAPDPNVRWMSRRAGDDLGTPS